MRGTTVEREEAYMDQDGNGSANAYWSAQEGESRQFVDQTGAGYSCEVDFVGDKDSVSELEYPVCVSDGIPFWIRWKWGLP